ncbi:hypothetical protein H5410_061202 [Solanum commersonii]|uniref:Uncharacterized protein n=1 Tax=Solanum commersonii TaxID=4109 RepID=A0A9J5W886_SOLCO|nr:hypothetical protein H5410_061202 [Solanum commersonii]
MTGPSGSNVIDLTPWTDANDHSTKSSVDSLIDGVTESMDTSWEKGMKRAERRKKTELADRQVHLANLCQALKEKIKLARERSTRWIAEWFRNAILDHPKLQT